jgi:hypothetical protein
MPLMEDPPTSFGLGCEASWGIRKPAATGALLAQRLETRASAEMAGFKEGTSARIAVGLPWLTFYFGP